MTPETQRIAIAEACGWKRSDLRPSWCHPDNWSMAKNGSYEVWVSQDKLPNYLNDHNAMHEAEELFYSKADTLEGAERMRDYSKLLCRIAKYPLRATASQRAEAFLRTIGKWEEAK